MIKPNLQNKLIAIVGPTVSGKTALAIKLAKRFNGEIISADSRQIFRGMNILTATPPLNKRQKVKHSLVEFKSPKSRYTAGQFKKDAIRTIKQIHKAEKLPILVGGSGLYISAVVDNLEFPKVRPNKKIRLKLENALHQKGLGFLCEKLKKVDKKAYQTIDLKNPRRVMRALEILMVSGKPLSSQRKIGQSLFSSLRLGVFVPADILRKRIAARTKNMIRSGLIEEVKRLLKVYNPKSPAFDAIGYKQMVDYLQKITTLKKAVENINTATWQYARRQMTWFKRDKKIIWVKNSQQALKITEKFLLQ